MRIGWRPLRGRRPDSAGQAGFRSVLLAALNTRYYGILLESAGLGTIEAIEELGSLEEALARLPRVEPGLVRMDSCTIVNHLAPSTGPKELFWPLPAPSRAALLCDGFRAQNGVRVFREGDLQRMEKWKPDALAAPVTALRRLAESLEASGHPAAPLRHSLIAFMTLRRQFLAEETRDRFWRVWQAPVFGQIYGLGGELLAWECEAHEGYHYDPSRVCFEIDARGGTPEVLVTSLTSLRWPTLRLATLLAGELTQTMCACGTPGPRLTQLRPRRLAQPAVAAAVCAAG